MNVFRSNMRISVGINRFDIKGFSHNYWATLQTIGRNNLAACETRRRRCGTPCCREAMALRGIIPRFGIPQLLPSTHIISCPCGRVASCCVFVFTIFTWTIQELRSTLLRFVGSSHLVVTLEKPMPRLTMQLLCGSCLRQFAAMIPIWRSAWTECDRK
jgi:hypothetical protein